MDQSGATAVFTVQGVVECVGGVPWDLNWLCETPNLMHF